MEFFFNPQFHIANVSTSQARNFKRVSWPFATIAVIQFISHFFVLTSTLLKQFQTSVSQHFFIPGTLSQLQNNLAALLTTIYKYIDVKFSNVAGPLEIFRAHGYRGNLFENHGFRFAIKHATINKELKFIQRYGL